MEETESSKLAKPGRPPKAKPAIKNIYNNISQTPHEEKNHVEFVHDSPLTFKKIFNLLKFYNAKLIIFEFLKDKVYIKTCDRNSKSIILLSINVNKTLHYYCKHDISIEVDSKTLYTIIETIHKTYSMISCIVETKNINKAFLIKFFDTEVQSEVLNLFTSKNNEFKFPYGLDYFNYSDYQLSVQLSCSYFKKTLTNLATLTEDFVLRQMKGQPLLIVSESKTKSQFVLDSDKIPIKYNGPALFTATCKLGYIQPLANGLTGETINIHAHSNKNFIFEIDIGNNITMLINTEVNN